MPQVRHTLGLLFILLAVTCDVASAQVHDRSAELRELDAQQAIWDQHAIDDYTVTVEESACYCLYGPYYGPLRLLVRNGKLRKAKYFGEVRDGYWPGDEVREESKLKRTIDEIFANLRRVVSNRAPGTTLIVNYDSTYGFPVLIDYNNPEFEHGDSKLTLSGFSPD
jgi:hypothetical protein